MSISWSSQEFNQALERLALEIGADRSEGEAVALIGIRRRGVPLANRLADRLEKIWTARPEVGVLDIAFYRDDLSLIAPNPQVGVTDIPFSLDKRIIYLVDDVLYTGRTIRAALDALNEFGRPKAIRLIVMVDRGHRELPIHADFSGCSVETHYSDNIKVMLNEIDGHDGMNVLGNDD
jgi:pyrimidine operon attenuation protein / uracil phosphoribosyltransferase